MLQTKPADQTLLEIQKYGLQFIQCCPLGSMCMEELF